MARLSAPSAFTPCTLLLLAFLRDATLLDGIDWSPAHSSPLETLLALLAKTDVAACEKEKQAVAWVDEHVRKERICCPILRRERGPWPRTRPEAENAPGTLTERYFSACILKR